MSLKDNLTKIAGKAKVVAEKSGDKIASGVDKATDKIDQKTGGKYHNKLEKVDKLTAKLDKDKDKDKDAAATEGADTEAAEAPKPDAGGEATPPTGTMPT